MGRARKTCRQSRLIAVRVRREMISQLLGARGNNCLSPRPGYTSDDSLAVGRRRPAGGTRHESVAEVSR
jgi:hypothetical protein